eukprot:gene58280-biopygen26322
MPHAAKKIWLHGKVAHGPDDLKVDRHYRSVSSKAIALRPNLLSVPGVRWARDQFNAVFGVEWDDAVAQRKVMNAADACGGGDGV